MIKNYHGLAHRSKLQLIFNIHLVHLLLTVVKILIDLKYKLKTETLSFSHSRFVEHAFRLFLDNKGGTDVLIETCFSWHCLWKLSNNKLIWDELRTYLYKEEFIKQYSLTVFHHELFKYSNLLCLKIFACVNQVKSSMTYYIFEKHTYQ